MANIGFKPLAVSKSCPTVVLLAAVMITAMTPDCSAGAEAPRQWRVTEMAFRARRQHVQPLDVVLTANFVGPGGRRLTIEGFYDGGRTWRVRFMPTVSGTWSYRTECQADAGLHNRRGRLAVAPAAGDNAIDRHGGILKVSENRRYLTHSDGTPFFWLGDTWWFCPSDLVPIDSSNRPGIASMYKTLIDTRAAQAYTVVHMAFLGKIQTPGGKAGFAQVFKRRLNAAYWRKVDRYIEYANGRGIVPAIGFGFHQMLNKPTLEQLQGLWRYALARYGSHAVAFLICGEYNQRGKNPTADAARVEKILRLGQYIQSHDPYKRALTLHPWAMHVEKRQVWSQPWYDVMMLQGAHGRTPPAVAAYRRALDHKPARPVIESECRYEGIRKYTASDVRHVAYRALQAGCRGFTYGSHGLWYPTQNETDRKFDEWGSPMPWHRAYKRSGGAQMKHLRACYESLEWWRLAPLPDAVQAEPRLNEQRRILAQGLPVDKQGQARPAYLIYFPAGSDKAAATLSRLGNEVATYAGEWFDPRTGERKPAGELRVQGGRMPLPARPSAADWVLRLHSLPPAAPKGQRRQRQRR